MRSWADAWVWACACLLRLRLLGLALLGSASHSYDGACGRVLAAVLVGDIADDRTLRRAANRAASGRWAAGRGSRLSDCNACHRVGRIDAGALARPGVAFAFVLRDLAAADCWRDKRRDPATTTRFAPPPSGRTEPARQQEPAFEASRMTKIPHELLLNATSLSAARAHREHRHALPVAGDAERALSVASSMTN